MGDDLEQTLRESRENLRSGRPVNDGISPQAWRALLDRYSQFTDKHDADGYLTDSEIALTALCTPRPCLHLMTSTHANELGTWGSFWDQFGGGFSCLRSVLAGRMTSHRVCIRRSCPKRQSFPWRISNWIIFAARSPLDRPAVVAQPKIPSWSERAHLLIKKVCG